MTTSWASGSTVLNKPNIAIEDVLVVVVGGLHHLVAHPVGPTESGDCRLAFIAVESGLQFLIEPPCTQAAPVHWAEHLHLTHRVQAEALRNPVADNFQNLVHRLVGVSSLNKIEVGFMRRVIQLRHVAAIDAMRVNDNPALCSLTKHFSQAGHGHCTRIDNVSEDAAGAYRGQQVNVADQKQARTMPQPL